jgi:hypothetical protein
VKVMFLNSSVAPKETPTLESERRVTRERSRRALARGETHPAMSLSGLERQGHAAGQEQAEHWPVSCLLSA